MASSSTTTVKSVNKYTIVTYVHTFDSSGSAPSDSFQIPPEVDVVSLQVGAQATAQTIAIQGSNDGVNFATITNATTVNLTREVGSGFVAPVVAQITNLSRASNIATAICNGSHYLKEGYKLSVYNVGVTNSFNTTTAVAISVPSANTFTYRSVGADTAAFTEGQAVLAVFDAGISEFLATSTHKGLKNAGHLYKPTTCLSSNTIAAGSYDLTTNAVNGARLGDLFALSPLAAASWNADLQVTADCIANNNIVITRRNLGTNSLSSGAGVWMVHMTRP